MQVILRAYLSKYNIAQLQYDRKHNYLKWYFQTNMPNVITKYIRNK